MANQDRTSLKGFFETGDVPTQSQFEDLIDSYVNRKDDDIDKAVADISELVDSGIVNTSALSDGAIVLVSDFYSSSAGGGGVFKWNPNESKSNHNGGTIINPDHQAAAVGDSDWYSSTGNGTDDSGNGCFIRVDDQTDSGIYNVKQWGALGDGATDDYDAFNAVISHLSTGDTIKIPKGVYEISSELVIDKRRITIEGQGTIGSEIDPVYQGVTTINVNHTGWGIKHYVDSTETQFDGITIKNVVIKEGSATASGGLYMGSVSNWVIDRCKFSGFTSGYGIRLGNSNAGGAQYGEFYKPIFNECQTAIWNYDHNGVRVFGGFLEYYTGGAAETTAGTTAIKISGDMSGGTPDTMRFFGTVIQFWELGVEVGENNAEFYGVRLEAVDTAYQIDSSYCKIVGGNINNSIIGSTGTAVEINAGSRPIIDGLNVQSVGTILTDNRSADLSNDNFGYFNINGSVRGDLRQEVGESGTEEDAIGFYSSHQDVSADNTSSIFIGGGFSDTPTTKFGGMIVRKSNAFANQGQVEIWAWSGSTSGDLVHAATFDRLGNFNIIDGDRIDINGFEIVREQSGIASVNYRFRANAGLVNQSGDTASRPSAELGQEYFDTDLGHPIWYDGTNWVDATGTTV